jgi:acetyl-CoA acetyltransferase
MARRRRCHVERDAYALGVEPASPSRLAVAGCEPDEMGIGPVFAVLTPAPSWYRDDIDVWAERGVRVPVVYCRDRLGLPMARLIERRVTPSGIRLA